MTNDILYPRYSDIKDILLASDAPAEASERTFLEDNQGEAIIRELPPPKKPADQKRKSSGPSNAKEAHMIREKLGLSNGASAGVSSQQQFSFGFAVEYDDEKEQAEIQEDDGTPYDKEKTDAPMTEVDVALQERLKRIMGETSGSTERRVFVGGMPFSYEESDVWDYWSYCGEIESLDLMRFPDTGRFKGIVFITFRTEEGYKAALECNGMTIDTVQIKVEPCKSAGPKMKKHRTEASSQSDRKGHSGAAPKVEGYNVAYVGNIAFEADEEDLRELFSGCNITKVRMHTDKDTGKFKGYAHVHFADEESLDRAMEYDGAGLKSRKIRVGYAQEKKPKM